MSTLQHPVQQENRFQIKWSNGYWKIFDTWRFKDLDIFDLRKDAEQALNGDR
jgi:hypothetical protein